MNVVVIGSGYVGLVTGCCLAEAGNHVICVDHDARKISTLSAGRLPFHEPGLDTILAAQLQAGRLTFETRIGRAMKNADVVFLAVGTPALADGSPNLENLLACSRELADTAFTDCLVVVKSTVPVGTSDHIEALLNEERAHKRGRLKVRVASNPEFLAEGRAVLDFKDPERIVIGVNDADSAELLTGLYAPFTHGAERLLVMDRRSAEFSKYACNAMLAARISMVNELAGIAGGVGADMAEVCRVMKRDPRIGEHYLQPGVGYGGSCLPKDLHALIHTAHLAGASASMLQSVQAVNQQQRERLFEAIQRHFGGRLAGRRIAVWGLAFKPHTDDVRAAPSLSLIRRLIDAGAEVSAYDPVAIPTARAVLDESTGIEFTDSALHACDHADALVVMTEWEEFKAPDFDLLATRMPGRMVFDARGVYTTERVQQHGFGYYGLASASHYRPARRRNVNAAREAGGLRPAELN